MRNALLLVLALVMCSLGCNDKKTDVELFTEGPVRISLTADVRKGVQPLFVSFSAYLESDDRTIRENVSEVKWIIRGPNGFEQEIIQDSFNYQDEEMNKEDFFFVDYDFRLAGKYKVKLELNGGQYTSPAVFINVLEDPRKSF